MTIIFGVFLALWAAFLVACYRGIKHLPRITDAASPAHSTEQLISIVIAVKDDVKNIGQTISRLASMRELNLEIIVVDDRSRDGTHEVIADCTRRDPRVKSVTVTELPVGWLGKVNALHHGVKLATGAFILFMDSDVAVTPELLSRSVAVCEELKLDHLAVLPWVPCPSYWLELLVVTSEILFTMSARPWTPIADRPLKCVKGIGAYNFVRKSRFDATEGFAWLKMDVADDVALAQLIAKDGGRSGYMKVPRSKPIATWSWYESAPEMIRGLEKNTVGGFANYRLSLIVAIPLISIGSFVIPTVGLFCCSMPGVPLLSALAFLLTAVFAVAGSRRLERRVSVLLAFPLGVALMGVILARSAAICLKNGGIRWRETFYPLADLRAGVRVRLGL